MIENENLHILSLRSFLTVAKHQISNLMVWISRLEAPNFLSKNGRLFWRHLGRPWCTINIHWIKTVVRFVTIFTFHMWRPPLSKLKSFEPPPPVPVGKPILFASSRGSIQFDIENSIEYSIDFSTEFCNTTLGHPVKLNRIFNRVFDIQLNWAQDISWSLFPLSSSGQGFQLWSLPRRRPLRPQTEAPRRGSFIDHLYLSWAAWTSEPECRLNWLKTGFTLMGQKKMERLRQNPSASKGSALMNRWKKMCFMKSDKCTVHTLVSGYIVNFIQ